MYGIVNKQFKHFNTRFLLVYLARKKSREV